MINKLTKAQESQLPEFRDKWLKIGLCTDRINRATAIGRVQKFRTDILNLNPVPVVFLDGPVHAWMGVLLYSSNRNQVRDQVWNQVVNQVENQVENQVVNQVWNQVVNQVVNQVWPYWSGHLWSGWCSFYDYIEQVLSVKFTELLHVLFDTMDCGLFYPLDNITIVSEKPDTIRMLNGITHCETGPSIHYADGTSVYSLNGVVMTKDQVETPAERLDPSQVLTTKNSEQRRELVRKVGIERMLSVLKSKTLHKRGNYELLSVRLSNECPDARYLKMLNPSIGTWHMEGVPIEDDTVEKCLNRRNCGWFTDAEILT